VLTGPRRPVPSGRYVRLFPFIGDLPAIPGRYHGPRRSASTGTRRSRGASGSAAPAGTS